MDRSCNQLDEKKQLRRKKRGPEEEEDKGRARRREGEGRWRDTGEGAEERRRERAGMQDEAGTMGESHQVADRTGKKRVQVSTGRDVLLSLEIPARWSEEEKDF